MSGKILTLQMIYKEGAETLEHAGIPDAKLDAWYLLEYVTGISRASYFGDPKREVPKEQAESYREVILRVLDIFRCSILPGNRSLWDILFW